MLGPVGRSADPLAAVVVVRVQLVAVVVRVHHNLQPIQYMPDPRYLGWLPACHGFALCSEILDSLPHLLE